MDAMQVRILKIFLFFSHCRKFQLSPLINDVVPLQAMHIVQKLKTCLSIRGKSPTTFCSLSQVPGGGLLMWPRDH